MARPPKDKTQTKAKVKTKTKPVEPELPTTTKAAADINKADKAEMKIVTVMDSVTVTITIPAALVSELVSKVGPKLDIPDKKSITSIITTLIQNSIK